MSRRARARSSSGDSDGVSSMKILASDSIVIALVTRGHSSSASSPVRRCCWLIRPSEEIRRNASCEDDISIEKIAAALPVLIAAYSAMFKASAVLCTQTSLATKLCVCGIVRSYTCLSPNGTIDSIRSQMTSLLARSARCLSSKAIA